MSERLTEAGVRGVLVVGADAREPAGRFTDAFALLEERHLRGHTFQQVGIGGYPEGHAHIAHDVIDKALVYRASHATHTITHVCFSAEVTAGRARSVKQRDVDLPVRVGIPGAVNRQKMTRISAGLGVGPGLGQSARFLKQQQSMFWRYFIPGGYRPDRLVERLMAHLGVPGSHLQGLHVFTFDGRGDGGPDHDKEEWVMPSDSGKLWGATPPTFGVLNRRDELARRCGPRSWV